MGTPEEYYIIKPKFRKSSNFTMLENKSYELFKKDIDIARSRGADVFYSKIWRNYNINELLNKYIEFFRVIK